MEHVYHTHTHTHTHTIYIFLVFAYVMSGMNICKGESPGKMLDHEGEAPLAHPSYIQVAEHSYQ